MFGLQVMQRLEAGVFSNLDKEKRMSILDDILGGGGDGSQSSSNSFDLGSVIGTNPSFGLSASDVLHSESSDDGDTESFTGIGDLGIGLSAPTVVGVNASSESSSASESDDGGGGLLGGLL